MCGLRDNTTNSHLVRCCAQLVSLLESIQSCKGIVVIATTDSPQLLDPSVRQSGRLDQEVLYFCFPILFYLYILKYVKILCCTYRINLFIYIFANVISMTLNLYTYI